MCVCVGVCVCVCATRTFGPVVDEHKLHPNVLTVDILETGNNLFEW